MLKKFEYYKYDSKKIIKVQIKSTFNETSH